MIIRKLLLFVLLVFACNNLFAAIFTVTSNADAGLGTLRQALADAGANGTTTIDYIYFNLPGGTPADFTITVLSQLPVVTGNVIIDGTTQPGAFLGVSNAKITITPATPTPNLNAFIVDPNVGANDAVEFYGMYIEGFGPNNTDGSAIYTTSPCKLVIGAPGKGNVLCGNYCGLFPNVQNAIVQSNFFGIQPDGATPYPDMYAVSSNQDYDNLLFGGNLPVDGNVVLSGGRSGITFGIGAGATINKTITIENNFFGTDYTGTIAVNTFNIPYIQIEDLYTTANITNNVFNAKNTSIAAFTGSTIVVKGNYFGIDKTQTHILGTGQDAIEENSGAKATIGGTAATDQNIFTGYFNPIVAGNSITNVVQNEFYCNANVVLNDPSGTNFIRITTFTTTTVAGDAPPGATVQLYEYFTQCGTCNPNFCFATVTANAAGKWQYNGAISLNVMASSTVNNNTYGFQPFTMAQTEATVTNFDCHHGGSITLNENRVGNFQFAWTDASGNPVGATQNISNLAPGTYTLQINETGSCTMETGKFTITDETPIVYGQSTTLSCNSPTGTFTTFPTVAPGLTVAKYYWLDANGAPVSSTATASNLAAGNYTLYITDSNGCNSNTVVCQVLPAAAPPVIDDSNVIVTDADCTASDGAVKGITATNTTGANYGWAKADGTIFNLGKFDLTNAPAGQYYFYIEYDFNCPQVKSRLFTINAVNRIVIDDSNVGYTPSTCSNSNGAIKGIAVTGATTYQWYDVNKNVVGNAIDLVGVPSGNYYLIASNIGCTLQSQTYTVPNTSAVANFQSTYVITDASCSINNGSVTVTFTAAQTPASYRWATTTGATIIANVPLTNQPPGTYQLFVTDVNGCESFYKSYTINSTSTLQIVQGSAQITNEQCGNGLGAIQGITVSGGLPPYIYTWLNASQQVVGNALNISGLSAGVYTLQVTDATTCGLVSQHYTINSQATTVPPPSVGNVQVCIPGTVLLMVNNPQPGYGYHLYDSSTGATVKDDEANGIFKLNIRSSGSFYVSQYIGNCESPRVEVKVSVGLSNLTIPNTFTPNGDGINDTWVIKGISYYPDALVQIFNRYGQKVFESRGYATPFDGKLGGVLLPPGAYYYIINLNTNCSLLSGSLTLLR